MFKPLLILSLFLQVANLHAAGTAYDPGLTQERDYSHIELHADGSFVETRESTWRVDGRQGVEAADSDSIYYVSSMEDVEEVRAWAMTPDGIKHPVDESMIRTQEELAKESDAEFSDRKSKTIIYPSVQVGSHLSYQVRINHHQTFFPGYFGETFRPLESYRVEEWLLEVDAPAGMKLAFEVQGIEGGLVSSSKGVDHYRFHHVNPVAVESEEDAVSYARTRPHVSISSYADPVALGRAYQVASRPMAEVTPAIRERALAVTANLVSTSDKARALSYWVARNIRYVFVGLGQSNLIPHKAEDVLTKLYGDCKDHAILLESMLTAVGIESSPALINSGSSYELSSVGILSPINHVINYVPALDLYIDSTDGFLSYGGVDVSVADKPTILTALGRLGRTPRLEAERNVSRSEQEITIGSDGQMVGHALRSMTGVYESDNRSARFNARGDDESKLIKDWLLKFKESGVGHFDNPDPEALGEPFWVKADYTLEPLSNFPGPGAMAIPVGLSSGHFARIATYPPPAIRRKDWQCFSRTVEESTLLHFPSGVEITYVPEGAHFEGGGYSYQSHFERSGQDIKVTRRLVEQHAGGVCGATEHEASVSFHAVLRRDLRGQVIYR